jgi:hypothetical protein
MPAKLPPSADANARSGSQHMADTAGVLRLLRQSEMPERGQLCGDSSQASPLSGLRRLSRQAAGFRDDSFPHDLTTRTTTCGCGAQARSW